MDIRALNRILNERRARSAGDFYAWLEGRAEDQPRCAATRYLLGCRGFDRGRVALGVRHMMVAHHAEPALESAALLVFAGLNWLTHGGRPLLTALLETWEEFRRPEFDRSTAERALLDAFDEPLDGLDVLSPLARRLWRLPIPKLRRQLREAVSSENVEHQALLLAPALQ